MNLNQLHYFVEAATQLSLSKAAENLYISQPALSRQIQALENTLGVKLFTRSNRGLSLTPAGTLLLQESEQFFRQERELLYRLRNVGAAQLSQIKIGFTNDLFSQKLNQFILYYARNFKPQKFLITRYNWFSLRHAMSVGSTDLVFCISNGLTGIPNLSCRTLMEAQNCIVLPKSHPLAHRQSVHLNELRDATFMFPTAIFQSAPKELFAICERYGFAPTITYEHEIIDSVLLDVAAGRGVTILLSGLLPPAYEEDLVMLPCPDMSRCEFVVAWSQAMESPQLLSIVDQVVQYPWF